MVSEISKDGPRTNGHGITDQRTLPSGHTKNLQRRHARRRRFVVMLHPYDVGGRRIYNDSTTNCDVARRQDVAKT